MIFATVGTQLVFPRLIEALDDIAGRHGLEIIAQTGAPVEAAHLIAHAHLSPGAFEDLMQRADRVVAHAGIGTVLTAQRLGKPLILFPRRASLGEHRNEHQLATVRALADRPGIHVAETVEALEALLIAETLAPAGTAPGRDEARLIDRISTFLADDAPGPAGHTPK